MRIVWRCVSWGAVLVGSVSGAARAAPAPLLVSVEVAPGVEVPAEEVRRAIASELGAPVVGSREPGAQTASDVLLVALASHELRMSLRAGASPVVSRAIVVPADRPGRLRSVGWLAGNLVRDQVGPIVAVTASPGAPAVEPRAATEPPALPESAPPSRDTTTVTATPVAVPDPMRHAPWSITASGGPTMNVRYYSASNTHVDWGSAAYDVEVRRQSSPDNFVFGAAIEVGPNRHYFGGAALCGSVWRRRSWFIEGDLGLGLEVLDGLVRSFKVTENSSLSGTVEETTVASEPIPGLYARLAGAAGVGVARQLDLVAEIGAHLSSTGQAGSYLSSTIGVRLRLP